MGWLSVSSATGNGPFGRFSKGSEESVRQSGGRKKGRLPCGAGMVAMRVLLWRQDLGKMKRN